VRARSGLAAASLLAVLALTACSSVDADAADRRMNEVFDDLVAQASAVDPQVLRTLETAAPRTQACSRPADTEQVVLTATGVLAVAADVTEAEGVRDDLGESLDPDVWRPLAEADPGAERRGWISEDGVTVTLASDGPAVVIAVFSPCLPG
jgi:hypothetical protein